MVIARISLIYLTNVINITNMANVVVIVNTDPMEDNGLAMLYLDAAQEELTTSTGMIWITNKDLGKKYRHADVSYCRF